jgi:hypothetical protein
MALGAVGGEVFLTGFRVSRGQLPDLHRASPSTLSFHLCLLRVDERDDSLEVRVVQIDRRHSFIDAAGSDEGTDLVAAHILGDEPGPRQIRTGVGSKRVGGVTKSAPRRKSGLAETNLIRGIGLRRYGLRRPLRSRALRRTAALPARHRQACCHGQGHCRNHKDGFHGVQ